MPRELDLGVATPPSPPTARYVRMEGERAIARWGAASSNFAARAASLVGGILLYSVDVERGTLPYSDRLECGPDLDSERLECEPHLDSDRLECEPHLDPDRLECMPHLDPDRLECGPELASHSLECGPAPTRPCPRIASPSRKHRRADDD